MLDVIKALDLSFGTGSADWWRARKAEGYDFAYFDAYTGGESTSAGLVAPVRDNPPRAGDAGLGTGLYVCIAPWHGHGRNALEGGRRIAAGEFDAGSSPWLIIDCEIGYHQVYGWLREGLIQEAIDAGRDAGFRVAVYTGAWWVNWMSLHYGHVPYFDAPIIYANYNGQATIGDPGFHTAGQRVVGHQYGGANIAGVDVDLNVVDAEFFSLETEGEPMKRYVRFETGTPWAAAVYAATAAGLEAVYDGSLVDLEEIRVLVKGTDEYEAYAKLPTYFAQGNPVA